MPRLDHQTVLITGASSGIGAALAEQVADQGATVILVARNMNRLETVANKISETGTGVHLISADLTLPRDAEKLFKFCDSRGCLPDVIVNGAGAGQWKSIEETSMSEARDMMAAPYILRLILLQARVFPSITRRLMILSGYKRTMRLNPY